MVAATGSGRGGEYMGSCSFVPFCKEQVPLKKQGRADHLESAGLTDCGSLILPLFSCFVWGRSCNGVLSIAIYRECRWEEWSERS